MQPFHFRVYHLHFESKRLDTTSYNTDDTNTKPKEVWQGTSALCCLPLWSFLNVHTEVYRTWQLNLIMCHYVFTICCSLPFLQAARALWSLDLETARGRTKQRSITDRNFWNSSFILSWSSSHRVNWDEHKQLGQKEKWKTDK